jgi:hypothetical protein
MGNCCSGGGKTSNRENPPMPNHPILPVRKSPMSSERRYVALHDYEARSNGELSFWKGDIFEVVIQNVSSNRFVEKKKSSGNTLMNN